MSQQIWRGTFLGELLRIAVGAASLIAAAVALGWFVARASLVLQLGVASLAIAYYVAWRVPVVAATIVLLLTGGYNIFATTPGFVVDPTRFAGGIQIQDVFLLGMLAAGTTRILTSSGSRRMGRLLAPMVACGAWLVFETARNVALVGLSAPGELRTRYLVLGLAFGIVTCVDREALVRSALRMFAVVTVALPLILLPAVLYLKGWSFSPTDRILPASVSLGLLLGLAALWVFREFVHWPWWLLYPATVLGAMEMLLDAHRSVWLAAIVLVGLLLLVQPRFEKTVRWSVVGLAAGVTTILTAQGLGYDVLNTVSEQGGAALALQGTVAWRLDVWATSLRDFAASPFVGRGLGFYFDMSVPGLGHIAVYPHNLYVAMLVHLGAIGVVLFVWLWMGAWRTCAIGVRLARRGPAPAGIGPLCAYLGLGVLGVIAAFGIGYGLEPYAVTLLGICLAGATGVQRSALTQHAGAR
jgi:hypothetical protein